MHEEQNNAPVKTVRSNRQEANFPNLEEKENLKQFYLAQSRRLCPTVSGLSCNSWGLSLVNSLHAYTFASLKRKKLISTTPLNDALNALILALNASAAAFVLLFTKKFKILS